MLNVSKRVIVVLATMIYFREAITVRVAASLAVLVAGFVLYESQSKKGKEAKAIVEKQDVHSGTDKTLKKEEFQNKQGVNVPILPLGKV